MSISSWPTWLKIVSVPAIVLPLLLVGVVAMRPDVEALNEANSMLAESRSAIVEDPSSSGELDGRWLSIQWAPIEVDEDETLQETTYTVRSKDVCAAVLDARTALSDRIVVAGRVIDRVSLLRYQEGPRRTVDPIKDICERVGTPVTISVRARFAA